LFSYICTLQKDSSLLIKNQREDKKNLEKEQVKQKKAILPLAKQQEQELFDS
jgi:hypothetical protein